MKKLILLAVMAIALVSCQSNATNGSTNNDSTMNKPFAKKYTNADFYKDGVFQQDVAKKAFYEMFAHYNYPVTDFLEKNIWFTDFAMGDFENSGMGGVFWVNDSINGYFAHAIYLLPNQMVPEHKHVKTAFPAKMESWMVEKGWCYNFSEVGDPTPNAPAIPASQAPTTISKKFVKQQLGEIIHLSDAGAETWHFLLAGDEGAIVSEWANYHDGAGLRFSNPKSKM